LLGRLVNAFSDATFVKHARDKSKVIQHWTPVRGCHEVLRSSGEAIDPLNFYKFSRDTAECRMISLPAAETLLHAAEEDQESG